MNHRKLIPANGISSAATPHLDAAGVEPLRARLGPFGQRRADQDRSRRRTAAANSTPAKAAARRVVRRSDALSRFWHPDSVSHHAAMVPDVRAGRAADCTIKPLASASSVPSGPVISALTKALRPSARSSPAPHGERHVDGSDVAVVDVQERGAADRPADGVDDHPEHRVEHHRHHPAVHGVVAADVEPAELHVNSTPSGLELRDRDRAPSAGCPRREAGHPVRPAPTPSGASNGAQAAPLVLRPGRRRPPRCRGRGRPTPRSPAPGGSPRGTGRSPGRDRPPRTAGSRRAVSYSGSSSACGSAHRYRGASTSRRTMVWSRPGPTPMHETRAPASSSSRST